MNKKNRNIVLVLIIITLVFQSIRFKELIPVLNSTMTIFIFSLSGTFIFFTISKSSLSEAFTI